MPDTPEQENLTTEEVVSLLSDDTPSAPTRKGYEDYVREAEAAKAKAEETHEESQETDGQSEEPKNDFQMPDKFQGKSAEEIAKSYMELQSEYGRRNNEVGSLRKLTDQLLELTNKPTEEQTKEPIKVDSLLDNPDEVINTAVDSNPRLKALEQKLIEGDRKEALKAFETKHPDWQTVMNSEDFSNWVMESQLRQKTFVEAHKNYDYAAGSELLEMYDLYRGNALKEATAERDTKARESAKQAVTETGGANETKSKRKFKRSELIQLKLTNPAKYESMKGEIMQAYKDKRVI